MTKSAKKTIAVQKGRKKDVYVQWLQSKYFYTENIFIIRIVTYFICTTITERKTKKKTMKTKTW